MPWSDPDLIWQLQCRLWRRGKDDFSTPHLRREAAKAKARCIELEASISEAAKEIDALRTRLMQIEMGDALREAEVRPECADLLVQMIGVIDFDGAEMFVADDFGFVTDIRTHVANLKLMHPEMFRGTCRRMSVN